MNWLFVLSYENNTDRTVSTWYYFSKVDTKNYNVVTDGRKLFNQPVNGDARSYKNIKKNIAASGEDCTVDAYLIICTSKKATIWFK